MKAGRLLAVLVVICQIAALFGSAFQPVTAAVIESSSSISQEALPPLARTASPEGGIVPSDAAGWNEGEFAVSHDGSATYTLPLWTPEGRGGLKPDLALTYSSNSENGLLGVGWSLQGLSNITQCARTPSHDSYLRPVRFDTMDAFCLDGNRLVPTPDQLPAVVDGEPPFTEPDERPGGQPIPVTPAEYWKQEYRTERDPFARIVAEGFGDPDGIPVQFHVSDRDGNVLTYGGLHGVTDGEYTGSARWGYQLSASESLTNPSLVASADDLVQITWALERVEDRNGNVITFEYSNFLMPDGMSYNDMRPHIIRYGPDRAIVFSYIDQRPDWTELFVSGVLNRSWGRIDRIEVFDRFTTDKNLLREYRLSYETTSITGRSLLNAVTECDGAGVCLSPHEFEWSQGDYEFEVVDDRGDLGDPGTFFVADVNGDGRDDLVYHDLDSDQWRIRISDGSRFGPPRRAGITPPPRVHWLVFPPKVLPVDVDRDGRTEVLALVPNPPGFNPHYYYLYRSNGSSYIRDSDPIEPVDGHCFGSPRAADLDGNGLPDFASVRHSPLSRPEDPLEWACGYFPDLTALLGPVLFWMNGKDADSGHFSLEDTDIEASGEGLRFVIDANGDGRDDLLIPHDLWQGPRVSDRYWAYGLNINGDPARRRTNLLAWWLDNGSTGWYAHPFAADVNGDGLSDVVWRNQWDYPAQFSVQFNSGNGFSAILGDPRDTSADYTRDPASAVLEGDFNHDGRVDFLTFPNQDKAPASLELVDWRNAGFQRTEIELPPAAADHEGWKSTQVLDIDGNGLLDLVQVDTDGVRVLKRTGTLPDLLVSIRVPPAPSRFKIVYTTLADRRVHNPGTCSYPLVCPVEGRTIVAEHQVATGRPREWNRFQHTYKAARVDLGGRGWLGFGEHVVRDLQTGAKTAITFDNQSSTDVGDGYVFPMAFLPQSTTYTVRPDAGTSFRQTASHTYALRRLAVPGTYTVELLGRDVKEFEGPTDPLLWTVRENVASTSYRFDEFGNQIALHAETADGRQLTMERDYSNNISDWLIGQLTREVVTSCTTLAGECASRESVYSYDSKGNVERVIREPNQPEFFVCTTMTHDAFGNVSLITESDAAGSTRSTALHYDADAVHLTGITNPLGQTQGWTVHSGLGVVLTASDPNTVTMAMKYDGFGRLRERISPDGSLQRTSYVQGGSLLPLRIHTTDADGHERVVALDPFGRERIRRESVVAGDLSSVSVTYDRYGRTAGISQPFLWRDGPDPASWTTYAYDHLGRLVRETAPDNATTIHAYRGLEVHTYAGHVEPGLDPDAIPEGARHSYVVHTADGDIAEKYEPNPSSSEMLLTRFKYGPFGNLLQITAADGTIQDIRYDLLGRRIFHSDPSAGTTTATFNAFDELMVLKRGKDHETTFEYDALGRLKKTSNGDGNATFTWDTADHGIGLLAEAVSADGIVTSYTYDEWSRRTATTWDIGGNNYEIATAYDPLGRVATLTYPETPGGARLSIQYAYDARGNLAAVTDSATGTVYWQASLNPSGQLAVETFGNGVVTTRTYQPQTGLLEQVEVHDPEMNLTLQDLVYTYDDQRNIATRSDTVQDRLESFTYDDLDRLITWEVADGGIAIRRTHYVYDLLGNLASELVEVGTGSDVAFAFGKDGAPPHALSSRDLETYTYDASGRQVTGGGRTITYNEANLPTSVESDGVLTKLSYDATQTRVLKVDDDETVVSVAGLYEQRRGEEIHHIHHIVAGGRTVAQVSQSQHGENGPLMPSQVSYLHDDRQGSVSLISDANGTVVEELKYDPFGLRIDAETLPLPNTPRDGPRTGYTGHQHDDELGLINMTGRIYDPLLRRFLTPDPFISAPLFSQSYNRYSYVWNNPMTFVDPTGYQADVPPIGDPEWLDWDDYGGVSGGSDEWNCQCSTLPWSADPPLPDSEFVSQLDVTNQATATSYAPGLSKQFLDLARIGAERVAYAVQAYKSSRALLWVDRFTNVSATIVEDAAIANRRQLEFGTRSRLPGPEPAETLNEITTARNLNKPQYRDAYGYRSPAHYRESHPGASTQDLIKSSGKTSLRFTSAAVAGQVFGIVGGVIAVGDTSDKFAGRTRIDIPGLDPDDFESGYEFEGYVDLPAHRAKIRVERNFPFYQKEFYLVDFVPFG
jgi:RHS repeat-associated protein